MSSTKKRLDVLLVERGLFPTRAKAQAAIIAGKIRIEGTDRPKAGQEIPPDTPITVSPDACPYVSRGGLKLTAALEQFKIDVRDRAALDVGSSTGGFTDCLLQHGAARVYAVDVGTHQLDDKLRNDPRVVVMEKTHVRDLRPELFEPRPSLAVVDVSFISLTKVLPYIVPCLATHSLTHTPELIALIKPQFELEPKKAPKGIVRKPEYHQEAIEKLQICAKELGLEGHGLIESPIHGAKGNKEFLIHLKIA